MEDIRVCLAQRFTTFFQRVTDFVSRTSLWWADQNNQTDEEEQNSGPPPRRPNAGHDIGIEAALQIADIGIEAALLIAEGKEVASWVTTISAAAIFSLSGTLGNKEARLLHEYIYTASMILSFVSFFSGFVLLLLVRKNPAETLGFVKITKFTIYFSQGAFVYAICVVVCLVLPSKFVVVFILVVPPFPFGLITTLSSVRSGRRSIPSTSFSYGRARFVTL